MIDLIAQTHRQVQEQGGSHSAVFSASFFTFPFFDGSSPNCVPLRTQLARSGPYLPISSKNSQKGKKKKKKKRKTHRLDPWGK
jgi:hypothetical protein